MAKLRWKQPSLIPNLDFLKGKKRKVVKTGGKTYRTGRLTGPEAPLGITFLGQRAARSKITRNYRKAS